MRRADRVPACGKGRGLVMAQQIAQDERGEAQPSAGDFDVPYRVGESLPGVCTVKDVARVFGISESAVHHLKDRGRLRDFLLPSLPGDRKSRYSGARLSAWLRGEFQPGRVFGRHAGSVR